MLIATEYRSIPNLINYHYKCLLSLGNHIACTYASECFSSIGYWDPQPKKHTSLVKKEVLILGITGIGTLYNSNDFLLLRWVGCFQDIGWKEIWHILNCNLDTTLPVSSNRWLYLLCLGFFFFFFLISQFLFLFFCIQRYMSSEDFGTLHSKSGTNPGERMRDQYLVSAWTLC